MIELDLDRFVAIELEELVARAELMTRVDRKYVLGQAAVGELLNQMEPGTEVLEIDARRQLRYASVYFDTPDLLTYRMCAQQRRRRLKIRSRGYLDSRLAFLEAKTRSGGDLTVKDRIACDWSDRERLNRGARSYAAGALLGVGQDPRLADDLLATLSTRYRRTTLLAPDGVGRVTIDTDLSWELPGGDRLDAADLVIVETKSAGPATSFDRLLWRSGTRPVSISKYATGLAALRPDLPHNRWARVLRDRFAPYPKESTCVAV